MAYDAATDNEAVDSTENDSERDDTFFIPPDLIPNAANLKPGDKLTFTLVGRDKEGHLEMECDKSADDEGKDMLNEMRGVEANANAGPTEGGY